MEKNKIYQGDCIEELKKLPDNSVDAIITDPPYGLGFMNKEWDIMDKSQFGIKGNEGENDLKVKKNFNILPRYSENIEGGLQNFTYEWSKEALRVLKPGGFLLSFGGTRTYHRMTCGIEDAGFEIRDTIMWLYGSGFPKSLNIGKQIDKMQGNKREVIGKQNYSMPKADNSIQASSYGISGGSLKNGVTAERIVPEITKGTSEWEGWGTALKPACEPIVVARKPLSEKNVALNVLKWGTGGINIDECRIAHNEELKETNRSGRDNASVMNSESCGFDNTKNTLASASPNGRFPANIILDEEAGQMLDEQSGIKKGNGHWSKTKVTGFGEFGNGKSEYFGVGEKDTLVGGASRFFYCTKASKSERNNGCENYEEVVDCDRNPECYSADVPFNRSSNPKKNNHPTVKPVALMEYLIKLVSKENAVILDPFLGSGTTAIACLKLNRNFIGIEKEADYVKIAEARIKPYLEQRKLEVKQDE
jgi:site-specific DNA-methyltransferase (adenine-specific)